jgi:2-polyprenyl-3-methyl-5-hydroxy-6-metoxy-1,4-benzoquinol methylase
MEFGAGVANTLDQISKCFCVLFSKSTACLRRWLMDLSVRSTLPEVMDDDGLHEAVYQRCLTDLAAVNRVTFTHRPTLRWLAEVTKDLAPGAAFSLLDVAYGHGDLLRAIAVWAARRGLRAELSGIDLNPRSAVAARLATPEGMAVSYHTGDVFFYTPEVRPDFIVSSQFTHHLTNSQVVELLRWFEKTSLRGWHIADLQRHFFAYYGFRILCRAMRWHPIVRIDGTISIARGFRRAEWRALIEQAGVRAKISWAFAFRLCVSGVKA